MTRRRPTATGAPDYDKIFRELFARYSGDIYRIVLAAVSYDDRLAQRLLYTIFAQVHKYIHTLTHGQNVRLYVLAQTVHELQTLETTIPSLHSILPRQLKGKLTATEWQLWQALHSLPRMEWLVYELWYGEKLDIPQLAVVLEQSIAQVHHLQAAAIRRLQAAMPHYDKHLPTLFDKRNQYIRWPQLQQVHVLRQLLTKRKVAPTFIEYPWWRRLLRPIPLTLASGTLTLAALVALLYYYVPTFWQPRLAPVTQPAAEFFDAIEPLYFSKIRPRPVTPDTTLPAVTADKLSLTKTNSNLFGTNYVTDRTVPTDEVALTPELTMALPEMEYMPVTEAYVYAVPEALTEDQLQYAALRHFISLPLNQFDYVNGTYYIGDDPAVYQPLFIAFNNSGSIDFQMRQQAICALPTLTKSLSDHEAELAGLDFLTAHNFIEVGEEDLNMSLVSSPNRTVAKDAFCQDGDQAVVQDREVVYFAPQSVWQYDDGTTDFLPMRVRGIAVQLHGPNVTNVRVDKLFLLQEYAVRTNRVELISLDQAMAAAKKFFYPAATDRAAQEQHQQVFMQWNHTYGDDRLVSLQLTAARLEYVFDELNYVIEPYYVLSGEGQDSAGKTVAMRLYVVASSESRDLRSPYRE